MKVAFLGTGSSLGIPVIACKCAVCQSTDQKDKRLRSSIFIETGNLNLIVDIAPDFRYQMIRENISRIDAVLLTHEHRDHIGGMDDIRAFNFIQKSAIDCYCSDRVKKSIETSYEYMFVQEKYPGIPELAFHVIDTESFCITGQNILTIHAKHFDDRNYELPVMGFRINDFTYLTDIKYISDTELEKVKGSKVMVINALRKQKHYSHLNLAEAVAIIKKTCPERAYITHLSHIMGLHEKIQKTLPEGVYLAWDGLKIEIN